MTARQFVAAWKREKKSLLRGAMDPKDASAASLKLRELALSPRQRKVLEEGLDLLLTDAFYTLLLGLDGAASVGGVQATYRILDERGRCISPCGEIEAEAYRQLQEG